MEYHSSPFYCLCKRQFNLMWDCGTAVCCIYPILRVRSFTSALVWAIVSQCLYLGPELLLVSIFVFVFLPSIRSGGLTIYCIKRNVGFLKYWKLPNLPLICMAAPMLFIMLSSSLWAINRPRASITEGKGGAKSDGKQIDTVKDEHTQACLTRLALTQAALAILAVTNYHIQIITRISSGYPLWYWFLSSCLLIEEKGNGMRQGWLSSRIALRGMVLYGIIQASLFASFLPPA